MCFKLSDGRWYRSVGENWASLSTEEVLKGVHLLHQLKLTNMGGTPATILSFELEHSILGMGGINGPRGVPIKDIENDNFDRVLGPGESIQDSTHSQIRRCVRGNSNCRPSGSWAKNALHSKQQPAYRDRRNQGKRSRQSDGLGCFCTQFTDNHTDNFGIRETDASMGFLLPFTMLAYLFGLVRPPRYLRVPRRGMFRRCSKAMARACHLRLTIKLG